MKLSEVFEALENDKKLLVKFKNQSNFQNVDMALLKEMTFNELQECKFQYAPLIINGYTLDPGHEPLEEDDYYCIPSFGDPDCLYEEFSWESDSKLCQFHLKHNLVYSTPAEAELHVKALLNIKE